MLPTGRYVYMVTQWAWIMCQGLPNLKKSDSPSLHRSYQLTISSLLARCGTSYPLFLPMVGF